MRNALSTRAILLPMGEDADQEKKAAQEDTIDQKREMPSDDPQNLFEWLWRLREYEDGIYIRVQRGEQWTNSSLEEATPKEWATFVAKALDKGMLPVRVKRDSELSSPKKEE